MTDLLDRIVDLAARAMDAAGLNGTRLRWKWNRRRRDLGETGMRAEVTARSARGRFKMCPSCRALVPRASRTCPECGAGLAGVRAPGIGRLVSNVLPGATAATALLLLANGAIFVLMLLVPVVLPYGRGPSLFGFNGETLVRYGAGITQLTFGGEWWRLVTPIFVHGGLLHFGMNSYALLILGPLAEEEYGTERFFFIYLAAGIAGNVLSQGLRHAFTVGASGAICGLLGLMLVHGWRRGGAYGAALRTVMIQNTILMLVISILPGVDALAHVGGFLAGAALGVIVPYGAYRNHGTALVWQTAATLGLGVALGSIYLMATHGGEAIPRFFGG